MGIKFSGLAQNKTTVDQEFFTGKNISTLTFSPGLIFIAMTTQQNKLNPFIRPKKYFTYFAEGDLWKVYHENFPIHSKMELAVER